MSGNIKVPKLIMLGGFERLTKYVVGGLEHLVNNEVRFINSQALETFLLDYEENAFYD